MTTEQIKQIIRNAYLVDVEDVKVEMTIEQNFEPLPNAKYALVSCHWRNDLWFYVIAQRDGETPSAYYMGTNKAEGRLFMSHLI